MLNKILKIKDYKTCQQLTLYSSYNNKVIRNKSSIQEVLRCSSSRSCSLIKDYILNNDFDYFFTLTLSTDLRYNIPAAFKYIQKHISNYKKNCSNRNLDFKYVYVFEKTKSGGLHLHGFFKGFYDLYENQYKHLSSLYFDKIGFQCFIPVAECNPFYLIKYIEKSPITEIKHRFFRSDNLKKPDIIYFRDNLEEFNNFCWTFQSPYCKMVTIAKSL